MKFDSTRAAYKYEPVDGFSEDELAKLTKAYFEGEASDYDAFDRAIPHRKRYLDAVDRYTLDALSFVADCKTILTFGCGTGRREVRIAKAANINPKLIGIETAPAMADLSRRRGLVIFDQLSAAIREEGQASVDAALCLYSFIHLPSETARLQTLREIATLLRPGAPLIIDVFNLNDIYEWPSKVRDGSCGTPPPVDGPHQGDVVYKRIGRNQYSYMHYFTVAELCSLLERAGYIVTDLTAIGHGYQGNDNEVALDEGCLVATAKRR